MGLTLRPDMTLEKRPHEGIAVLRRRDGRINGRANGHAVPDFRLHPLQAMVLALMDGRRSVEEVRGVAAGVLECPDTHAAALVDGLTERFRQFLVEPEGADGEDLTAALDPAEFLFATPHRVSEVRAAREEAPVALMWVVTELCNKKCRYCYKNALFVAAGGAADATLSLERVREIAAEAAAIGVHRVILTGGEPFLRPDLIEVIRELVERRLEVVPITKARISGERMKALAATGLEELHLSLDSHRPEVVDFLTGIPGAFEQLVETLVAAVENGLSVVLRPVMTSYTVRDLPGLVELACGLGVRKILVDTYGESCGRHEESLRLRPQDEVWLRRSEAEIAERFPEASIHFRSALPAAAVGAGRGCAEGMRGLTFLPDGRVTKCEHWQRGQELTVGDLKTQSIMEVWESDALQRLLRPARGDFAGSPCFRCKKLDDCNELRGRCSLSALEKFGTLGAPDCYCPIGAFGKTRLAVLQ